MDITRLFIGIVMLLPLGMMAGLAARTESWRAAVMALHLNWEREQRQAMPGGVPLAQRQEEQTQFEILVSSQPVRVMWMHVGITLAAIIYSLILAWRQDDLRFIGLWLILPLGMATAAGITFAWMQMSGAATRLSAISASLYGPPPPRVKVRSLQVAQPDA